MIYTISIIIGLLFAYSAGIQKPFSFQRLFVVFHEVHEISTSVYIPSQFDIKVPQLGTSNSRSQYPFSLPLAIFILSNKLNYYIYLARQLIFCFCQEKSFFFSLSKNHSFPQFSIKLIQYQKTMLDIAASLLI